jgi:hypothetical protein
VAWYAVTGRDLSDADLLFAIEDHFGEWLIPNVCVPFGYDSGACCVAAAHICGRDVDAMMQRLRIGLDIKTKLAYTAKQ